MQKCEQDESGKQKSKRERVKKNERWQRTVGTSTVNEG
jgi:hypothetical protein